MKIFISVFRGRQKRVTRKKKKNQKKREQNRTYTLTFMQEPEPLYILILSWQTQDIAESTQKGLFSLERNS